jgi:hypothetical protein
MVQMRKKSPGDTGKKKKKQLTGEKRGDRKDSLRKETKKEKKN